LVVRQKNPVAKRCTERQEQESQWMLPFGVYAPDWPAAILSLSFKNATPPSFAPWRPLPSWSSGALHCTGTVAGAFSGGYRKDIWPGSAATAPEL